MSVSRTCRFTLTATVAALCVVATGATAQAETQVPEPARFTSAFTAMATPDMVVNADGVSVPGAAGASGTFTYRINSDDEIICYDITTQGVTGPFASPAKTATHIHQAAVGAAGPPRLAFPNPSGSGDTLRSSGCLKGPFTTGIVVAGADTGTGFSLKQIEADPAAFFTDTHTAANTAGAIRGQLRAIPVGGVATGAGGTAQAADSAQEGALGAGTATLVGLAAAAALGAVAYRRRSITGA